jgi:hypothetical protein
MRRGVPWQVSGACGVRVGGVNGAHGQRAGDSQPPRFDLQKHRHAIKSEAARRTPPAATVACFWRSCAIFTRACMGSGRRGAYRELTMSSCPASAMASAEGTGHEPRTAAGMGRSGGAGDDGRTYYGRCSTLGEGSWAEVLDLGDSLGEEGQRVWDQTALS